MRQESIKKIDIGLLTYPGFIKKERICPNKQKKHQ
jgi:hypothetical protein